VEKKVTINALAPTSEVGLRTWLKKVALSRLRNLTASQSEPVVGVVGVVTISALAP
jgi:hypothetical protein